MNTETGKINIFSEDDLKALNGLSDFGKIRPIDINLATEKQKTEMQVSKHDSKSELGKIFTGSRRERREKERAYLKSIKNL